MAVSCGRTHPRRIWGDGPVHGPRPPCQPRRHPRGNRREERDEGESVRRRAAGRSSRARRDRRARFRVAHPRAETLGLRDPQLLVRSECARHGGRDPGRDPLLRSRRPVSSDAPSIEARRPGERRGRDVRPGNRFDPGNDECDGSLRRKQTRQGPQGPPP